MVTNLVQNGSFETLIDGDQTIQFSDNRAFADTMLPGWSSLNGEQLEVWNHGFLQTGASDGNYFLELDHLGGNTAMDGLYQDIQTEAGKTYQLSFDVRARSVSPSYSDEALQVEWNGQALNPAGYHSQSTAQWTTVTLTVTGTGGLDRLTFRELQDQSDGGGPFIDNVQLVDTDELQTEPNGQGFTAEVMASGLVQPIAFAHAPDGRIFVTEKAGRIVIVQDGEIVSTFLDINEEVNSFHDRGMMGLALDPNFSENGHVYVQYSVDLNPDTPDEPNKNTAGSGRIIRITADRDNPNVADPASRVVIQDDHVQSHSTHTVGDVDFDNDGNLIFTWGDGGFSPALRAASQDPASPQGKIFRINPETFAGHPDNPNYDPADPSGIESRVWAIGIRNSWKITVDRETGDVYMGEATDHGPEEINVIRADGSTLLNFGWPYFEDNIPTPTTHGSPPPGFEYTRPVIALEHTEDGGGDVVTGGAVIRSNVYPGVYEGRYIFANFNQGRLYTADQDGNYEDFGAPGLVPGPVDIQMGPDGHVWIMSLFTGEIVRLVSDTQIGVNVTPKAAATASQTAGYGSVNVNFDASGSTDANNDALLYQWDFNSDGIVDAQGVNAQHVFTGEGRHTATLTVDDGHGGRDSTVVEVDVGNPAADDGNIAYGRKVTQSGVTGEALGSRAVDGNTDGNIANGSVSETVVTRTPLWEVDLGEVRNVGKIELHARTDDGDASQLTRFWVLISENPFSSGNLHAARTDPGIWVRYTGESQGTLTELTPNVSGRYVRVQKAQQLDSLALAEVKIFENPNAAPGALGSEIEIYASGSDGRESMDLLIDGKVAATFGNISTSGGVYRFTADGPVSPGQISVAFTNDTWNQETGVDYNLTVDKIAIDGTVYETEGEGVTHDGWTRDGEKLLTNGAFHFADPEEEDTPALIQDAELMWA